MTANPKTPPRRDETEPPREAADFMLAAIAGYFERQDLPDLAPPPARRRWPIRTLLASALGLVILAAVAVYVRAHYAVVPDFTGMNETQAQSILRDAGLVATIRSLPSTLVREHHVIEQDPPAGGWLRKGTTVDLTASSGLPRVAVHQKRSTPKTLPHPVRSAAEPRHAPALRHAAVAPRIARAPKAHSPAKHTTVAVAPARAPVAESVATPEPQKTSCPKRSWLQKTVQNVFAPRAPTCHWSPTGG